MLDVKELSVTAKNGQELLHRITLQIEAGKAIGLTGQSGAGKTTLLKALLGILGNGCRVITGDVFIDEQPLWKLSARKRRSLCGTTLGFIPQNPMTAFDARIKIENQITETLRLKIGLSRDQSVIRSKELLKELGLSQPERILDSYPAQLSGGMLQRVTIALLLALNPKYILADEPTSALDTENRELLLSLLQKQKEKTGILFISHDVEALCTLCSKVHVIEHGRLTEEGTMQELLSRPKQDWTKQYAAANKKVNKEGWLWKD